MNEKLKGAELNGGLLAARGCDRAPELIAYLYGEAAPAEAQTFRRHLDGCAICLDELAAFGGVRETVGEWRSDAVSVPPALDLLEAYAFAEPAPRPPVRERSALAALREFFSLSPLWLKAGACAATLAVCALAALTLTRSEVRWNADGFAFRTGVRDERVVEKRVEVQVPTGYTPEQVEEIVKQRLEVAQGEWESKREQPAVAGARENRRKSDPRLETASNTSQPRRKRATPRLARRDAQSLEDEDSLPRLSDLLGGAH
ncbi:MAG: zf-HC2 domain-containing protein [Acidobacteria bacterium]|nr:zf-HC2 domain-containing protein [Acidobacteriota bacterium]